jgi:alcohol dehydrogenase
MKPTIAKYIWPGPTHFGFGAAALVGPQVKAVQGTAVFILSDPGVIEAGLLEPVIASLDTAGLSHIIYDQTPPNPDIASINTAGAAFRASGADAIVAVGGGSVLDAGKAVRLLVGGPEEASVAEYALILRDKARPAPQPHDMPPMIAIPTTAGTGSEVTPWALITDLERKLKFGVGGAYLMPNVALIDPEVSLSLPATLTAATGIDALSHCIEAYVSTNENPALDPMILYGIELIGRSLRLAVAQPGNHQARQDMMLAAMIGGIAISSRWLGACHALAHQLSSFAHIHHGVAIALMLPHQMAYSLIGALERYSHIAAALAPYGAEEGSLRQRAERAVTEVRQLITDVGLPTRLRDVGITGEMISPLAKNATIDLNWQTNPRLINEEAMAYLYEQAF